MVQSNNYAKGKEIVSAEGNYIRQTEKAHLVDFSDTAKPIWLPVSQYGKAIEIADIDTGECTVFIPRWLAEKNNISYEEYDPDEEGIEAEEEQPLDFDHGYEKDSPF